MDIRESIDETAAGLTAQIKSEYSEDLEMSLKGQEDPKKTLAQKKKKEAEDMKQLAVIKKSTAKALEEHDNLAADYAEMQNMLAMKNKENVAARRELERN